MKISCLVLMSVLLCLCSCGGKYNCEPRKIGDVNLYNRPKTDSAAKVIRCGKGSNFAKRIDSSSKGIYDKMSDSLYLGSYIGCDISDDSYDYIIVLLPTGKTYRIKDIRYGHETYRTSGFSGGGSGNDPTISCSYGYNLNGQEVNSGTDYYNRAGNYGHIDLR